MEIKGVANSTPYEVSAKTSVETEQNNFSPTNQVSPVGFTLQKSDKSSQKSQKEGTIDKFSVGFGKNLSPEEQKRVEELKRTDAKVRAHEMAHIAAGGGLVRGGANYQYEIGPDGKQYAVGGEVKIDMSVNPDDPEGAIQKMQQVRRAALAPADPSPQDRSVAQQASNIEAQMRAKLLEEKTKGNGSSKLSRFYKAYHLDNVENNTPSDKSSNNSFINVSPVADLKKRINLKV